MNEIKIISCFHYDDLTDIMFSIELTNKLIISFSEKYLYIYDSYINEEDELYDKEKIYDDEIKTLIRKRNDEINNIILKYEDKISKDKNYNKPYLKKNIQLDDFVAKNNIGNGVYSSRWKLRYNKSSYFPKLPDI